MPPSALVSLLVTILIPLMFIVGAGAYYLSRDTSKKIVFDPREHSLEKLHLVMEDTYLEYGCAYIFYYNMILNLKEKNELKPNTMETIKVTIENYTDEKDEQVCKRYNITT
jgi:hypothetical protein